MTDIVKKQNDVTTSKPAVGSFKDRAAAAKAKGPVVPGNPDDPRASMLPNRIAFLLDHSGSMDGQNMDLLKQACEAFMNRCNARDTAIAIETFPSPDELGYIRHGAARLLTSVYHVLRTDITALDAEGGTPMDDAMRAAITKNSLTRAVMVSDGQPDDPAKVYTQARDYKERNVPIDCIHIGSGYGEEVMQKVAEITGGIYMKFSDVSKLVGAFKYLTPAMRGLLVSGDIKALTGADEVGK